MFNSLNRVDWDLLHEQKQILVAMRAKLPEQSKEYEALSGVIHLLDALQDDAVTDGRWTFPNGDEQKRKQAMNPTNDWDETAPQIIYEAYPDHDLLPQMSAQVFFVVAEAKHVPIVPMAALRPVPHAAQPDRYTAEVLENGKPVRRAVTVGVTNRLSAEVKSGLEPGDEVILNAPAGEGQNGSQVPSAARRPRL